MLSLTDASSYRPQHDKDSESTEGGLYILKDSRIENYRCLPDTNRRKLLHKPFPCPFETVPTVHEDEAADILVEGKDGPHGNQSPTHADTQHVAADYLYRPHHADAHVDGEVDVARAT